MPIPYFVFFYHFDSRQKFVFLAESYASINKFKCNTYI
jgi:hypothetical protein